MDTAGFKFAKPMRKKKADHSRRKKTLSKRRMVLALDKAARQEIVIERDQNVCQRCGWKDGDVYGLWSKIGDTYRVIIQWAHVHTREYYCTRWEPDNSLALCSRCHVWFDNHKVLSFDWFAKKFPDRWERITRVLQSGNNKTTDADIRELWRERCGGIV